MMTPAEIHEQSRYPRLCDLLLTLCPSQPIVLYVHRLTRPVARCTVRDLRLSRIYPRLCLRPVEEAFPTQSHVTLTLADQEPTR